MNIDSKYYGFIAILIGALLGLPIALAQQPASQQSSSEKALMLRVGQEVNANLQCSAANIGLDEKLKAAEAEVKMLKDKYEPKKDEKK